MPILAAEPNLFPEHLLDREPTPDSSERRWRVLHNGAVVEAFDVRKVVKEQVESLGAKFIEVETEDAQTAGGYARELSEESKRKQAEAVAQHVAKAVDDAAFGLRRDVVRLPQPEPEGGAAAVGRPRRRARKRR